QALLLIGGAPEVMHGAPQALQRAGDGQGQAQAKQRQDQQRRQQRTQRQEQAAALPFVQAGMGNPIDEQVSAASSAFVLFGDAPPVEAVWLGTCLEGGRAGKQRAFAERLALFVEYLDVQLLVTFALF